MHGRFALPKATPTALCSLREWHLEDKAERTLLNSDRESLSEYPASINCLSSVALFTAPSVIEEVSTPEPRFGHVVLGGPHLRRRCGPMDDPDQLQHDGRSIIYLRARYEVLLAEVWHWRLTLQQS